jgi:hypothetical protein
MVDNFEQEILFEDLLPQVAQISKRRSQISTCPTS